MASRHPGELTPRITLTRHRLEIDSTDADLEAFGQRYATEHVLRLPQFLGDDLLSWLDARLPAAGFTSRIEDGVEIEQTLTDPSLLALLMMPINDPALFRVIDRITGCGVVGNFTGRVHCRGASDGRRHYYPWHTDATDERLVGISVNLGSEPFAGGTLQMRRVNTETIVAEANNTVRGDALIFRISEDFEHHVTPVTGPTPRVVLAGWFRRTPDFWAGGLSSG